jgi:hypothetical protein
LSNVEKGRKSFFLVRETAHKNNLNGWPVNLFKKIFGSGDRCYDFQNNFSEKIAVLTQHTP